VADPLSSEVASDFSAAPLFGGAFFESPAPKILPAGSRYLTVLMSLFQPCGGENFPSFSVARNQIRWRVFRQLGVLRICAFHFNLVK